MKGELRFIGLLNEKELIHRPSLDKIISIPHLDLILSAEQISSYTSVNLDRQLYHYTVITKTGEKNIVRVGKFELIELSPDRKRERIKSDGSREIYKTREFIFYDTIQKVTHKFESEALHDDFIISDLWPLIKRLQAIQDWELLMQLNSIPALQSKIVELQQNIKKQELIIQDLKTQLGI